jgi:hypothetical protein
MKQFSIFEYIALIVALSGILISISLGVSSLWNLLKDRFKT